MKWTDSTNVKMNFTSPYAAYCSQTIWHKTHLDTGSYIVPLSLSKDLTPTLERCKSFAVELNNHIGV